MQKYIWIRCSTKTLVGETLRSIVKIYQLYFKNDWVKREGRWKDYLDWVISQRIDVI